MSVSTEHDDAVCTHCGFWDAKFYHNASCMRRGEIVGYSPAGLAAAAVSGLAILGAARALVRQPAASQADVE